MLFRSLKIYGNLLISKAILHFLCEDTQHPSLGCIQAADFGDVTATAGALLGGQILSPIAEAMASSDGVGLLNTLTTAAGALCPACDLTGGGNDLCFAVVVTQRIDKVTNVIFATFAAVHGIALSVTSGRNGFVLYKFMYMGCGRSEEHTSELQTR